jgi:RecB family exonuclease
MTARVVLLVGPGGAGKTARLVDEYRHALGCYPPGSLVWLTPRWPLVEDVRSRLLTGPLVGCLAPGVMRFDQFVARLLREGPRPVRLLGRRMRRFLLAQLIAERWAAGRLEPWAALACNGGLLELASAWIAHWKRHASPPDHGLGTDAFFGREDGAPSPTLAAEKGACPLPGRSTRERAQAAPIEAVVWEIFHDYQRLVERAGLCDADDAVGLACQALQAGGAPWVTRVRRLVVDGFTTFTPAEYDLLELLAQRVAELWITLDGEPEPQRRDLFHLSNQTREELRRRHPDLEVHALPRCESARPPALAHLERTLFAPAEAPSVAPRQQAASASQPALEIWAVARQAGEIEALAALIKRLLIAGDAGQRVRPGEIVVVFRSLVEQERLVDEVFRRYGIPFILPAGLPLTASPSLVALRNRFRQTQADDALPRVATLGEWRQVWQALRLPQTAAEAWARLTEALDEAERLARWLGAAPAKLDRRQAALVLGDLLENVRLRAPVDPAGRVRVMGAHDVVGLSVPYLFLAGLSEKSFPAAGPQGVPHGAAATERAYEEMLLFYQVVTRATRRLVFSYPALDASGQPLTPSPYLEEVEQACGPQRIVRRELGDLSPIPRSEPLAAVEFRVQAVATALEGNVSLLAGLVRRETSPGLAENLLAALNTIDQRARPVGFGPWEGVLSPQAACAVQRRFTPTHAYSPTELQTYAGCPFRFFLERVLRIEPPAEPGLATDFLARGQLLHQVLAHLHRGVNQHSGRSASPAELEPAVYDRLLAAALADAFPGTQHDARAEIDRRVIGAWLAEYYDQCARYDARLAEQGLTLRPAHFEVAFGQSADDGDPLSTAQPLELQMGNERVALCGRIDRLDLGLHAGRACFNVIDYKSGDAGGFSAEAAVRGTALQLPLYLLAAERVLLAQRGAAACQAAYWSPAGGGYKPRALVAGHAEASGITVDPRWELLREQLTRTVLELVRAIRRAEFPVVSADDECTGRCPFHTVCRVQQVRGLKKG